ncbi:MAG: adenosylcobinamide-GDP ribazoletransferase [Thermoleophilaceae bacterium]
MPVRLRGEARPLGAAAGWFPAIGALVGALAGGIGYVAEPGLGADVAAVLAVAVLVTVTGALHQDGLADCADGLGARGDRARRLAITRDSSIGTFGALALFIWLALLVAAISGLDRQDALGALVVVAATGRWAALVHATAAPPARPDGLGAAFAVSRPALATATLTAAAAALAISGIGHGLACLATAAVLALLVSAWARRSLGGRTGDTLGATVAITEVAVAVVLLGLGAR